ncbi:MAG: SprT-like domain-containing protein [Gammaproteobacteria bacterium]|nr:SprT-like domain-containing protein [Gammaproteobacteria bacterium]
MTESLFQRATQETRDLIRRGEDHFGVHCPLSGIHFDLKGKAAGMVVFTQRAKPFIRYNPLLLKQNPEQFLSQTLPHEVSHLISRRLHGADIRPHGMEWQQIMQFFGAQPKRCHQFSTEELPVRKMRRFPYRCACRQHQLTAIRHNRIRKGQIYRCTRCGNSLLPVSL